MNRVGTPKNPAEKLLPAAVTITIPAMYARFTASAHACDATPPMLIETTSTRVAAFSQRSAT